MKMTELHTAYREYVAGLLHKESGPCWRVLCITPDGEEQYVNDSLELCKATAHHVMDYHIGQHGNRGFTFKLVEFRFEKAI